MHQRRLIHSAARRCSSSWPAAVCIDGVAASAEKGDAIVVPPETEFELANGGDTMLHLLCCFPVGGQAHLDGASFTPPWAE